MHLLRFAAIAASAALLFTSCQKTTLEKETLSSTVVSDAVTPDLSKCKIRRIYQNFGSPTLASALFSYNKAGNIFSVIYSNGGTGVNNHYFFYDNKNRLIEYQTTWGFYVTSYHYYKYNNLNQIVSDSSIEADCCGNYPVEWLTTFDYDAAGRIVRETIVNTRNDGQLLEKTRRPTYTYDNRGNLGVLGWKSSSYDNKINPLRQSPVLQFIMRNYSMNNAAVQPKYNSIGLPLSIVPSNDGFFNTLSTQKIVYDCQ